MIIPLLSKQLVTGFTFFGLRFRRLMLPICLCILILEANTHELIVTVLADTFWQVAVFVAFTLRFYHIIADYYLPVATRLTKFAPWSLLQVMFASGMGALPGCGGAIIIVTQFVAGRISFGAVVAALTATMGDAAFLLLAAQPVTGGFVVVVGVVAGIIMGCMINLLHGQHFLHHKLHHKPRQIPHQIPIVQASKAMIQAVDQEVIDQDTLSNHVKIWQGWIWKTIILPFFILGLMLAMPVGNAWLIDYHQYLQMLGAGIMLVAILLWSLSAEVKNYRTLVAEDDKKTHRQLWQKVALDTHFVSSWVIITVLVYELLTCYGYLDMSTWLAVGGAWLPLLAIFIGVIPGCGPQIITTTMYINGELPLSAQLGNAISNDGDALFAALVLSPKVALIATLYTSLPALLVAYGYFFFCEV